MLHLVKSFCVKFCKFVGSSYPHISTIFCRFILIFQEDLTVVKKIPQSFRGGLIFLKHPVYRQTPYILTFIFITYEIYIFKHAFPITILQNIMCKCAKSFSFSFRGYFVPQTPPSWRALSLNPTGDFRPPNLLIDQCLF